MNRLLAILSIAGVAAGVAGCRQAAGLDQFDVQCAPGEPGCPDRDGPEDCVSGLDTNGDGAAPPPCSGNVAWLRVTPGNGDKQCTDPDSGVIQIDASRRLVAMASFGTWSGAAGTLRGQLGPCQPQACAFEAHGLDELGDQVVFNPGLPCDDSGRFHALARGEDRAWAAAARDLNGKQDKLVSLSAHRLADGSFASRWDWQAPAGVTSLALAADQTALLAVGQGGTSLLVEPDRGFPQARFHRVSGGEIASVALTRANGTRTALLAGLAVTAAGDPGPCGIGAGSPAAFVAKATLGKGSTDATAPTEVKCGGFPLKLPVGMDTKEASMRVAALRDGRACWAFLGTDTATDVRRLRVGCLDLNSAAAGWKQEAVLGGHVGGEVDVAVDPFGHVVVAAVLSRTTQLDLWGGVSVPLAAPDAQNVLVAKLRADSGAVVWAQMFAAAGGNARDAHVAVDDDGSVRLGVVTDGQALTGKGLTGAFGASGTAVHFLGLRP